MSYAVTLLPLRLRNTTMTPARSTPPRRRQRYVTCYRYTYAVVGRVAAAVIPRYTHAREARYSLRATPLLLRARAGKMAFANSRTPGHARVYLRRHVRWLSLCLLSPCRRRYGVRLPRSRRLSPRATPRLRCCCARSAHSTRACASAQPHTQSHTLPRMQRCAPPTCYVAPAGAQRRHARAPVSAVLSLRRSSASAPAAAAARTRCSRRFALSLRHTQTPWRRVKENAPQMEGMAEVAAGAAQQHKARARALYMVLSRVAMRGQRTGSTLRHAHGAAANRTLLLPRRWRLCAYALHCAAYRRQRHAKAARARGMRAQRHAMLHGPATSKASQPASRTWQHACTACSASCAAQAAIAARAAHSHV